MFARFAAELPGFAAERAIFQTPYLSMPPPLVDWLLARSAAVRIAQDKVAAQADARIQDFRDADGDWLVLVLHGADGEGWGSLALPELAGLVDRCCDLGFGIRPLIDILVEPSPSE